MGRREQECEFGSLACCRSHEAFKKIFLRFSEVKELYSESVPGEDVCNLPGEWESQSVRCRYVNGHDVSDDYLHNGIDIAPTSADIADPGGAAAGRKFKFYFSEVCITL